MMTKNSALPRRLSRCFAFVLGAFGLLFLSATANASCRMPGLHPAGPTKVSAPTGPAGNGGSIVGLWHVAYTDSLGNPFLESFDTWHADGTEFEIANADPDEGNVCAGVWKKTGPNSVKLSHIGWNFYPDGVPNGYFTISETNTVAGDGNSYHGTFDFKVYDTVSNGCSPQQPCLAVEVTGTQEASRIVP